MTDPDTQALGNRYGALSQAQDYSHASWWSGAAATFGGSWDEGVGIGAASRIANQTAADAAQLGSYDEFGMYIPGDEPSRRTVSSEEASRQAREMGVNSLNFGGTNHTPEAVDLMINGELERRKRGDMVASSGISFLPRAAIGLAAGIADPLNLALAFTPIAPEVLTARVAAAATVPARIGARIAVGAVEGAGGAATLEPLNALATTQEGRDYGVANALTNLLYGAGFGAALHPLIGAVGDVWQSRLNATKPGLPGPGDIAARLHTEAHEQVLQATARDLIAGEPVRAGDAIKEIATAGSLRETASAEAARLLTEEEARAPLSEAAPSQLTPEEATNRKLELQAASTREEELLKDFTGNSNAVRQAGRKLEAMRRLIDDQAPNVAATGQYYIEQFQKMFAKFELSSDDFLKYVDLLVKSKRAKIIDEETGKPFKLTKKRIEDEKAPGTFIRFTDKASPRPDVPLPYERDALRAREQAIRPTTPTPSTTGLTEGLGSMGAGIGENLRNQLWASFQAGKEAMSGVRDPVLVAAAANKASIKSRGDFDKFLVTYTNKGRTTAPTPEQPSSVIASLARQEPELAKQVLVSSALRRDGPEVGNIAERNAWWMERLKAVSDRKKKTPEAQAEADYTKQMRTEAGVKAKTTHEHAARRIAEYEREVVAAERTSAPDPEPAVRDDPLEDETDFLRSMTEEHRNDPDYKLESAQIAAENEKVLSEIDTFTACLLGED